MIQFIGNNRIPGAQNGFKEAAIGIKTGGVEKGVLGAQEPAQASFQIFVQRLCATDKPHGSHPKAISPRTFLGRLDQLRVVGQTEIVVGTKIDTFFFILDGYFYLLG